MTLKGDRTVHVPGKLTLGADELSAAGGEISLRILIGNVASDGLILQGDGFSCVRLSVGWYRVTFPTPWITVPSIIASPLQSARLISAGCVE